MAMSETEIEEVCASEVYPKPFDSDNSSSDKYLPGEGRQHSGRTVDGSIVLTNFRLYTSENAAFNIPLGLIEQVEYKEMFSLNVFCKDARTLRCTFSSAEECQKWLKWLQDALLPPDKLDDFFSFRFYLWSRDEKDDTLFNQLHQNPTKENPDTKDHTFIFTEAERMGFDLKNIWKISKANIDYNLCSSYPQHIIVPISISDADLDYAARFRVSRRIPVVVWRHQQNGCVIARCSQPEVGFLGWRSKEDEDLIQAVADACRCDPGYDSKYSENKECFSLKSEMEDDSLVIQERSQETEDNRKLLIIDARSYVAAFTNRAKGGGHELMCYYTNCDLQFLSLANIHSIRKSFLSVRTLCGSALDHPNWLSSLENTKWLQHISGLIRSALLIVDAVDIERRPVLVHCSDGWDRTPQIVALAELMMDPFYRTRKGFQVLIEREWLEFGHKFADRCGHTVGVDSQNERSPVFLQWLDCVHQLLYQFPCHFEFNQQYLVKLVHHTYTCIFGTFLCNTDQERRKNRVHQRTFSVWPFLNENMCFHNYLFNNSYEVLRPSYQLKDLKFWNEVYLPAEGIRLSKSTIPPCQEIPLEEKYKPTHMVKTKSCENILSLDHPLNRKRRKSDSNIENISFSENAACSMLSSLTKSNSHLNCSDLPSHTATFVDNNANSCPNDTVENFISERTETLNHLKSSSELTLRGLTITDSSDTLVSENEIISQTVNQEIIYSHSSDSGNFLCNGKLTNSVSTSTTDLFSPTENTPDALMPYPDSSGIQWYQSILDAYIAMASKKKRSSGSCSYATPHHSRTPSSGFPATPCDDSSDMVNHKGQSATLPVLGADGLPILRDVVQERLRNIFNDFQKKIENLECDLWAAQNNLRQACNNYQRHDSNGIDGDECASLADSVCSDDQGAENSVASDASWEQVDQPKTTLWVPDHAVSKCTGCDAKFWTGRRKHHCRKCGRVFCSHCSSQEMPVPTEQLYDPVRVCCFCFKELYPQCRQSVVLCDKLPKTVITAASN